MKKYKVLAAVITGALLTLTDVLCDNRLGSLRKYKRRLCSGTERK